jgi:hypothetical protein
MDGLRGTYSSLACKKKRNTIPYVGPDAHKGRRHG